VRIGRSGVTTGVIEEIIVQLKNREAVKVKLLGTERSEIKRVSLELADRCSAELVDVRGNTVTLWRK
jgi:RNA-binding protein